MSRFDICRLRAPSRYFIEVPGYVFFTAQPALDFAARGLGNASRWRQDYCERLYLVLFGDGLANRLDYLFNI